MARSSAGAHCSVRDGVARLELRRPRQGNRIDEATAAALCEAALAIELDDRVRVVLLRARGASFGLGVERGGDWEAKWDWVAAIGRLTCPVIAVVDGPAVAEGCELALACDLRVASHRASFCLPQLSMGTFPRHGATQRLPRLIGRMRAMDLLLSGRRMRAREAADIGLVTRLTPAAQLPATVRREVAALLEKGPVALRFGKEAVEKGLDLSFEQGVRLEQDLYVLLQTTADRNEGIQAFLEKRKPRFSGR